MVTSRSGVNCSKPDIVRNRNRSYGASEPHVGGEEHGALTSFDAAPGKPRRQWTGDGPGSGSPVLATFGVRQVIAQTQKFLVGLNASNGALRWHLPFRTDFDQNAFTPVVFQDLLINAGIDQPLTAIRPKLDGGEWIAETVWSNLQTPMFMSSPVLIAGTIYGLTLRSRGQFVAIDAKSGKRLWNTHGARVRTHRSSAAVPGCSRQQRTATWSSRERTLRSTKRCAGILA